MLASSEQPSPNMSTFTQKWIAILALALMPAGVYANICATWGDLAKIGATL